MVGRLEDGSRPFWGVKAFFQGQKTVSFGEGNMAIILLNFELVVIIFKTPSQQGAKKLFFRFSKHVLVGSLKVFGRSGPTMSLFLEAGGKLMH